jgi:hypothetical protein
MSFIDSTYFTGEIAVPSASSETALTQAITQYEKEILISLLGYKLYSLLIADLSNGAPVTQKYIDLVNGKEFVCAFNGTDYTVKWEGLKNTALQSLIAYYVFYKYVERNVTSFYGTGVSQANVQEGWQRVNPVSKMINAWERMRELYGKFPPEYKLNYSRPIHNSDLSEVFELSGSAYNFLLKNKTDYPDWIFTPLWYINQFGI